MMPLWLRILVCCLPLAAACLLGLFFYLWPTQTVFALSTLFAGVSGYVMWHLTGSASDQGRP